MNSLLLNENGSVKIEALLKEENFPYINEDKMLKFFDIKIARNARTII